LLFGCDPVSKELLRSLEARYPPVTIQTLLSEPIASVRWVVVLSGGHTPDARLPGNAQLSRASLARVVEGVRLHQALPESRLLLSGGAVFGPHQEAETMARVAELLGVDKSRIILEIESRDTAEGGGPFPVEIK
ncbi:MAG: ElyC/SanA/YdcF family protein, partial [Nitrospirales bacterium]